MCILNVCHLCVGTHRGCWIPGTGIWTVMSHPMRSWDPSPILCKSSKHSETLSHPSIFSTFLIALAKRTGEMKVCLHLRLQCAVLCGVDGEHEAGDHCVPTGSRQRCMLGHSWPFRSYPSPWGRIAHIQVASPPHTHTLGKLKYPQTRD